MFHATKKTPAEEVRAAAAATIASPAAREEPRNMTTPQRDHPTASTQAEFNAVLGKGSEFEGKLTFQGTVRIDGTFSGQITTNDALVIGEGAKVSAEIVCGSVLVHGDVTGNVRAEREVELRSPAKVPATSRRPRSSSRRACSSRVRRRWRASSALRRSSHRTARARSSPRTARRATPACPFVHPPRRRRSRPSVK